MTLYLVALRDRLREALAPLTCERLELENMDSKTETDIP